MHSRWQAIWSRLNRPRRHAWGAVLDEQAMVLAALSMQSSGGVRVVMFEHAQAPDGLVHPAQRDDWLVQALQGAGEQLPRRHRVMALALHESRCWQGETAWRGTPRQTRQAVRELAAQALGLAPGAVGYDFARSMQGEDQVQWAACRLDELRRWQEQARSAGWRLPVVEPLVQSVARAARHLRSQALHHWGGSPQDWQFDVLPQRNLAAQDMAQLRASAMWAALAACGVALRGLRVGT